MPVGQVISTHGFIPRKFENMSLVQTTRLSNLVEAGVVVRSPRMDGFMSKGGIIFDMPFWNDVQTGTGVEGSADVDRISSETFSQAFGDPADNPHAGLGGANTGYDPPPNRITSDKEVGVRLCRNNSWGVSDLSESLMVGGPDVMSLLAARTAPHKQLLLQRLFLTTCTGLFADNDAIPDGTEHVQGDLTLDISNVAGGSYAPGQTDFGAAAHIRGLQLLGDSKADMVRRGTIMMHSIVTSTIAQKDLIETVRDSQGNALYDTFKGMRIIENDEMTSPSSGVYDTYYFAPGSFLLGVGSPKHPIEFERKPGAGNGAGQEIMYHRWEWCLHPVGHAWQLASTGGGPTYAQIAHEDSWKRVYPERKQIRIIRIRTREHAPV